MKRFFLILALFLSTSGRPCAFLLAVTGPGGLNPVFLYGQVLRGALKRGWLTHEDLREMQSTGATFGIPRPGTGRSERVRAAEALRSLEGRADSGLAAVELQAVVRESGAAGADQRETADEQSGIGGMYRGLNFPGSIQSLAFSPDGTRLIVGTSAGLHAWSYRKRQSLQLEAEGETGYSAAFFPAGDRLVTGHGTAVQIRDAFSGRVLEAWNVEGKITDVRTVAQGRKIVVVDGRLHVFDAATHRSSYTFGAPGECRGLSASDDGAWISTFHTDLRPRPIEHPPALLHAFLRVLRMASDFSSAEVLSTSKLASAFEISASGLFTLTAEASNSWAIYLNEMNNWRSRPIGRFHHDVTTGVAFVPGRDLYVSASRDGSVRLFDMRDERRFNDDRVRACGWKREKTGRAITVLAVSADGEHFAAGDEGGGVEIWKTVIALPPN